MKLQHVDKLEKKRHDILAACEKIYIDMGYKSALNLADKRRKDTEDKEATLI